MIRPLPLTIPLFCLCLSASLSGGELRYTGRLSQVNRGESSVVKTFEVRVTDETAPPAEFHYLVSEERPMLPWIERFGTVDANTPFGSAHAPAIGYRHDTRLYALAVQVPMIPGMNGPALGNAWQHASSQYEIVGERTSGETPCWVVQARTGPARTHTFLVRKQDGLIASGRQTVFVGQGDKFQIDFELTGETPLEAKALSSEKPAWESLMRLRKSVDRKQEPRTSPLTPEQVRTIAEQLPALAESADGTPLAALVSEAVTDIETSLQRMKKVDELGDSLVGSPAPPFLLTRLDGTPLPSQDLAGKVIVLHFWSYQDEPLEQPYGQTGYLDFMNTRWKGRNVVVLGVAVDSRLTSAETRGAAIRSARKLKDFMRLNYEITYDGGAVLNSFGNPTRLGEEMPLWVVIGADGKIAQYQTGNYEVDNQRGLKRLDLLIEELTKMPQGS